MIVRLSAIAELISPVKTWNPSSRSEDGTFRYIDLSSVDNETKTVRGIQEIQFKDAPSRARQLVRAGDILVSTVRPNLNGVAKLGDALDGATASTGFCVLRPNSNVVDGEYLFQWVKNPAFISDMIRKATGASYPAVSDRIIGESTIPLPPLDEQRRIAAILDQADDLHRKRREALKQAEKLEQSLFFTYFGGLRIKDLSWPLITVGEAGKVQLGRQRAPQYQTGRYTRPYVRVANVFENRIDTSDLLSMDFDEDDFEKYRLNEGDILLNEGQSTELVGRPAMWRSEVPNCCFQNTLVRFVADRARVDPIFSLMVFLAYFKAGEFSKISSKTSSVAHLGSSRFEAMPFPLPPLDLQRSFAARVAEIDTLKARHCAHLAKLDALFASLQHRAFRGEL